MQSETLSAGVGTILPTKLLIYFLMSKRKVQFYVVWQGREPGVYDCWSACEKQVKGVSAKYKGFATLSEAEKAFAEGWESYLYSNKSVPSSPVRQSKTVSQPLLPALAVDAACSGNPGVLELRGVIADTGSEVFHRGPYRCGTNNIGEFLAIVLGLAYLKAYGLPWVLYSDSKTALSWVRQKQCKTKLVWTSENQELLSAVRSAEKWLHENSWTTDIRKWDTDAWGEIPADFGRK